MGKYLPAPNTHLCNHTHTLHGQLGPASHLSTAIQAIGDKYWQCCQWNTFSSRTCADVRDAWMPVPQVWAANTRPFFLFSWLSLCWLFCCFVPLWLRKENRKKKKIYKFRSLCERPKKRKKSNSKCQVCLWGILWLDVRNEEETSGLIFV